MFAYTSVVIAHLAWDGTVLSFRRTQEVHRNGVRASGFAVTVLEEHRAPVGDLQRVVEWIGYEEHYWELFWRDRRAWQIPRNEVADVPELVQAARAQAGLPNLEIERLGLVLREATLHAMSQVTSA